MLHSDLLILSARNGPQLAPVCIGDPIRTTYLSTNMSMSIIREEIFIIIAVVEFKVDLWPMQTYLGLILLVTIWRRALTVSLSIHFHTWCPKVAHKLITGLGCLRSCGIVWPLVNTQPLFDTKTKRELLRLSKHQTGVFKQSRINKTQYILVISVLVNPLLIWTLQHPPQKFIRKMDLHQ